MEPINKHYSRKELLSKLRIGDPSPRLGFPPKPKNLPRKVSKDWVEAARKLHSVGLLWTWEKDAQLLLDYVSTDNLQKRHEISREFIEREPDVDPAIQLQKQADAAAYWKHFTVADLERLRLTGPEAVALQEWQKNPPAVDSTDVAVPTEVDNSWKNRTPGVPELPAGLTVIQAAFWKIAAISVLFGVSDEIEEACHMEGGVSFFVDRLIESLPRLQQGKAPRV